MKAIMTTYHYSKGSRITADDGDGNRLTLHYRSELNSDQNHAAACRALCEKMGWGGALQGGSLMRGGKMGSVVWVWLDKTEQISIKPLKAFAHPAG